MSYSVAAGMWAVLWTDLIQFIIKMTAVVILAIYAVRAVGGMDALKAGLAAHFGSEAAAISFLPVRVTSTGIHAYPWMPLVALLTFLSVQWWAAWYPGAEPGGGGYVAQRIFSAKTEKDGVLATLFFQFCHYAIRPWPWIVTGLATILLYPNLVDKESGYVKAFVDLLPTPWRGVMMAGFAAAYMSTVGTQLNWGASYLVNDFYKRFLRRNESEHHYVKISRWTTIALFLASAVVAWQLNTVEGAWKFLLAIGAGTGLVLILRWYWWRVNAWSEISAMIASFVASMILFRPVHNAFPAGDLRGDAWLMLITVAISTVVWVSVTFLTAPETDATLDAFYLRVRPGGRGWRRVSERLGYGVEQIPGGALAWTNWIAGIVGVYSTLFGIGKIVFGDVGLGLGMLVVGIAAFAWIARSFQSEMLPPSTSPAGTPEPARAQPQH
jgi:Na+/proline symporter